MIMKDQITKHMLTQLGLPKNVVKRVTNIVENHLFVGLVGTKGQPEEYRKLALTLGGDIDSQIYGTIDENGNLVNSDNYNHCIYYLNNEEYSFI